MPTPDARSPGDFAPVKIHRTILSVVSVLTGPVLMLPAFIAHANGVGRYVLILDGAVILCIGVDFLRRPPWRRQMFLADRDGVHVELRRRALAWLQIRGVARGPGRLLRLFVAFNPASAETRPVDLDFAGAREPDAARERAYLACVAGLRAFGDPAAAAHLVRDFETAPVKAAPVRNSPLLAPFRVLTRPAPFRVLIGFTGLFLLLGFLLLGQSR